MQKQHFRKEERRYGGAGNISSHYWELYLRNENCELKVRITTVITFGISRPLD
jgi:hypothetical protein